MARLITPERAELIRQASAEAFPHPAPPGFPVRRENLSNPASSNVDLWQFYASVPEVRLVVDRVAGGVERVNFRPCLNIEGATGDKCPPIIAEDGTIAEGIDTRFAADCAEIWSQVRSPMGNQSGVFGPVAASLTVAGDGWQFGYPGTPEMRWDPAGTPMWVGLARSALTEKNQLYEVQVGIDGTVKVPSDPTVDGHGTAIRIWRTHPQRPAQATVWLSSCIRPIQILSAIYEAVAAVALSRLNAGLIVAADDQDQLPVPGTSLIGDGSPKQFPLGTSLKQALYDEIGDHVEASQAEVDGWSRAVPAVIGVNSTLVDKIKLVELARNMDPQLGERIDDLRKRIFRACPLPLEVAEGMSEVSGLGGGNVAAQIDLSEYQRAILPPCELISDANTMHVLRAGLLERGYSRQEADRVQIGFSAKNLLMPPDRSDIAVRVGEMSPTSTLLAGDEIREATGLGEFGGPDDDELQRATALWLMGKSPDYKYLAPLVGLPEPPAPTAADPTEVIDSSSTVAAVALPSAALQAPKSSGLTPGPPTGVRQASAIPPNADTATGYRLVAIATRYEEQLATLCESIIARMTERASSRVASLAKTKPWADLRQPIQHAIEAAPHLLGAVPGVMPKLAQENNDGDLFEPVLATFAAQHETMTRKAQKAAVREVGGDWDAVSVDADEANAASWALLGTLLVGEARFRFEGQLPAQQEGEGALSPFGIPAAIISRVSAVAGGQADAVAGAANARESAVPLMQVSTGPVMAQAAEKVILGYLWDYRPELERNSYEPHLDMQAVFGFNEDDFDGYYPSDHPGCLCVLTPVFGAI